MKIVRRKLANGTIREYRYRRRRNRILPHSLGAIIQEYRRSPEYEALKPATKVVYERAIALMAKAYTTDISEIKRRHAISQRNKLKDTPAMANQVVAVLSLLMAYAVAMEYIPSNPVYRVPKLEVGEYARWEDAAVTYALAAFPKRLCRPLTLALYTGQRCGDVLRMRWSDYEDGGIQVVQEKTGARVWIPCHSTLKAALEEWKRDRTSVYIVTDSRGQPYRPKAFQSIFSREMRKHRALNGLVFHGLRKTAAAKMAEAGCSLHEIAAITGHKTVEMIMHYTSQAEQKARARAAIEKLENAGKTGPKPLTGKDVG